MVVQMEGVVKRYGDTPAVDHVDLAIDAGEVVGLLGPNGAGKTTTIRGLCGLVGFDDGAVSIFGTPLAGRRVPAAPGAAVGRRGRSALRTDRALKRRIGLVPQDIAVFEDLTAEENVTYFASLYGLTGRARSEGVAFALDFVGLSERKDQKPKAFSGGMKRRLNIACAVAHRPELVILDEPTVGIDPQSRNHILESVRSLNREGATIIYTSHYMEEVEAVCSRVVVMDHGRVIAAGTRDDLRALVADQQVIHLELERMTPAAVDAAQAVSGVRECVSDGNKLQLTTDHEGVRLGRVIERVMEAGGEVLSAHVERPTLESVFLTLTGRSLRD